MAEYSDEKSLKGFKGVLSNVDVTQVLQMVSFGQGCMVIKVFSKDKEGVFYVKDGQVLHAATSTEVGEKAFKEMALWEEPSFEIAPAGANQIPVTISRSWEYIALEVARIKDEQESKKINKVLIVDDSTFFARQLKQILEEDPYISVVGIAANGEEALDIMEEELVDVVTLDVFMPVMAGDTTLKHLMIRYGVPVIILSAFLEGSADYLFDFLRLGAIDIFPKPKGHDNLPEYGNDLRRLIKKASRARVDHFKVWKPHKDEEECPLQIFNSEALDVFLVIIGAEGSHVDWFRLPLKDLLSISILGGLSAVDPDFLSSFASLIERYKKCEVTALRDGTGGFMPGRLNLLSGRTSWDFSFKESVMVSAGAPIKKGASVKILESNIIRLSNLLKDKLGILCFSGAEGFSVECVRTLLANKTTFIVPSLDSLMLPEMAESILEAAGSFDTKEEGVILCRDYDTIPVKWREIMNSKK